MTETVRGIRRFVVALLCLAAFPPASAVAQTGQTAQIPLQFDFLNPGARSLGLGSAFVAVADDATSAFTNPAGLTLIPRMEISAEMRYRGLNTPYLAGGRLSGNVTNQGIDTVAGPVYDTSSDSQLRPYFLSFVYPKGRLAVALYRHELVRQTNSFLSQGPFRQVNFSGTLINDARQLGLAGERDIRVDNYGAAVAYRVSDQLSVGAGLALYRFHLASDFGSLGFLPPGSFNAVDLSTRGLSSTTTQAGDQTRIGINAGVLVKVSPKVQVGAVVRTGASFDFTQVNTVPGQPTVTEVGRFRTPIVIGGGVRLTPTNEWSFAFDVDRVQYSRLKDDYIAFQIDPSNVGTISVPDGTELHFAAEYTIFSMAKKPSLRFGAWYDPTHSVHYATNNSNSDDDVRLKAIFPAGENRWHFSFGAGMPLSKDFEINVGADFTKERRYVSTSVIVHLGK